jgi:hypothetical protein
MIEYIMEESVRRDDRHFSYNRGGSRGRSHGECKPQSEKILTIERLKIFIFDTRQHFNRCNCKKLLLTCQRHTAIPDIPIPIPYQSHTRSLRNLNYFNAANYDIDIYSTEEYFYKSLFAFNFLSL